MKQLLFLVLISVFTINSFSQSTGSFIDPRDGHLYKTVTFGLQTWMAENLDYNWLNKDLDYKRDMHLNLKEKDSININKGDSNSGKIYNDLKLATSCCPSGWHLPSKEEFEILLLYVGGEGQNAYNALMQNGNSGFNVLPKRKKSKSSFGVLEQFVGK